MLAKINIKAIRAYAMKPVYGSDMAAGADLHAWLANPITLRPGARSIITTGLSIELPRGREAQIRPRSGLAAKFGVTVLNAPGTIDADYRGEIGVILINLGENDFTITHGDRIAQMVITEAAQFDFTWRYDDLPKTERGKGGFGSTGVAA